jgi:hypothetical protein
MQFKLNISLSTVNIFSPGLAGPPGPAGPAGLVGPPGPARSSAVDGKTRLTFEDFREFSAAVNHWVPENVTSAGCTPANDAAADDADDDAAADDDDAAADRDDDADDDAANHGPASC